MTGLMHRAHQKMAAEVLHHSHAPRGIAGSAAAVLLFAVAYIVYLNSLSNGFALDDVAIIHDNARVHDLSAWREIWLTPYWPFMGSELGLWRPLAVFGYALQWYAGGGSPLVFHVVSVALHAAVTLLVFQLLLRLTAQQPAFWGALIFAVHPVHTEVVANVVGQAELLAAAASLIACLVFVARPSGSAVAPWRVVAVTTAFAAAIMSKEHAVVLPALLVAVDLAQRRVALSLSGLLRYSRDLLPLAVTLAVVLGGYLLLRHQVLDGSLFGEQAGPQLYYLRGEYRLHNALRAFPELLRLLFFPARLSADYSPAMILPVEAVTPMVLAGAAMLLALIAMAALTPLAPAAGLAAAWFLVTVLAVSNLFFAVGVLIAERTLYLPSVAVSLAVAQVIFMAQHRWAGRARTLVPVALLLLVVLGGYRTWTRNPDWRSTRTIQEALIRDFPESYKSQWTQASWHWQLGRADLARRHFELAVRIYPTDSDLLMDFGSFLVKQQELDSAQRVLSAARELQPRMPGPLILLGAIHLNAGSYAAALDLGEGALADGVDPSAALPIIAGALDGLGHHDQAIDAWRTVLDQATLPARHWAQIALTLAARGAVPEAARAIAEARRTAEGDSATIRLVNEAERRLPHVGPATGAQAPPLQDGGPDARGQAPLR